MAKSTTTKSGRTFSAKLVLGNRSKKRADVYLVDAALAAGYVISVVVDGQLVEVDYSSDRAAIFAVLDDVDDAIVNIYDADRRRVGSAFVVYEYGQSPDEIVAYYSADGWVSETMDRFSEEVE